MYGIKQNKTKKREKRGGEEEERKRRMDTETERTLSNLHVISAISQNDKLMTNEDAFQIYTPPSMRGAYRALDGETRVQNIQRIRTTVRSALASIQRSIDDVNKLMSGSSSSSLYESENTDMGLDTAVSNNIRMIDTLNKSKVGLANILQTYRDDTTLSSQVQLVMEEIADFLLIVTPRLQKQVEKCSPFLKERMKECLTSLCSHSSLCSTQPSDCAA